MKAVILTAGQGRRMRPYSDSVHKALLPVADSTVLGRIVDGLRENGIHDIVLVTGYRAEQIRDFLYKRYPGERFTFVHNERFHETNNIHSLSLALTAGVAETDVILIESDLIFEPSLIARLLLADSPNVALVDRYRAGMDGTVVSVEDGLIAHVYPPHLQGHDFCLDDKWKTLNIYRFSRAFWNGSLTRLISCYANLDNSSYYEHVLGMLIYIQHERIHALSVDGRDWAEVDDPNDLAVARFVFNRDERSAILEHTRGGFWSLDVRDFSLMRNARFPPPALLAAMRERLPSLIAEYGSTQAVLAEKLTWFLLCTPGRAQPLNGCSQIFPWLRDLLGARRALLPAPTFGEYARSLPVHATYADAPGIDWDDVECRARDCDLVVFVNPNNPTGTTLGTGELHAFAARHRDKRILVDESFIDFTEEQPLLARLEGEPLDNVLLLKSLGKALGAPGLRLGYAYSSDSALMARLLERIPIWNLSSPAEFFLEVLLKFRPELSVSFAQSRADREAFAAELRATRGVTRVVEGGGSFVLVTLEGDARHAASITKSLLAHHGMYVKDVSSRFPGDRAWLRIALRLPKENSLLTQALLEVLNSGTPPPEP